MKWVKLPNGSLLNTVSGIVWRNGRAWIFALAVVAALLPSLASARGPIVSTGDTSRGPIVSGPKK